MVILKQKLEDKNTSHNKINNKQQSTLNRSVVPNQKLASEKLIRNLGLREDVKIALDQHIEELIKKTHMWNPLFPTNSANCPKLYSFHAATF